MGAGLIRCSCNAQTQKSEPLFNCERARQHSVPPLNRERVAALITVVAASENPNVLHPPRTAAICTGVARHMPHPY